MCTRIYAYFDVYASPANFCVFSSTSTPLWVSVLAALSSRLRPLLFLRPRAVLPPLRPTNAYQLHTLHTATRRNTLRHTATRRNTLRHTATRRNTLRRTATHYSVVQRTARILLSMCLRNAHQMHAPQHTATRCNTLQRASYMLLPMRLANIRCAHCNTLHHAATQWKMLQHTATHC